VIQIVAKLRRIAAFTAAVMSLSVLSPGASNAQSPPPPPPADTTAKPAAADTTAKPATQPAPGASVQSATPAPATPAPASTSATSSKSGKSSKPPKSSSSTASAKSSTPKASKPKAPKAAAAAAVAAPSYEERRKAEGVYAKGANWLGLRFGYANKTGELSGDGFIGYGMSYTRILTSRYAFAAGINHDIVGHFADQIDVAVPITGEFQRIIKMGGEMRSYIGLGGGYYFRKYYRTGTEYNTTTAGGGHLSLGFTSQLDDRHVIGFETRVAWVQGRPGVTNPTFGPGTDTETLWTAKLTWALVY
jgi:hypothetical protein